MRRLLVCSAKRWGALLALVTGMFCAGVGAAHAQVAHDSGVSFVGPATGGTTVTGTLTCSASRLVTIVTGIPSATIHVTGISGASLTWNNFYAHVGNSMDLEVWWAYASSSVTSQTITITVSSSLSPGPPNGMGAYMDSWSGTDTTSPLTDSASFNIAASTASPLTNNLTTTVNNSEVFAAWLTPSNPSYTAFGTGWSSSGQGSSVSTSTFLLNQGHSNSVTSPAGSVAATISYSGTMPASTMGIFSIKPPTATANHNSLLLMGVG